MTCTPPPAPAPTATPVTSGALKCKRGIAKNASKFYAAKTKILQKCDESVVKTGAGSCPDATATAKIASAAAKLASGIDKACGGDDKVCGGNLTNEEPPAGLGWPATCPNFESNADPDCSAAITDCGDIAACIGCVGEAAVDQAIALYYGEPAAERAGHGAQQVPAGDRQGLGEVRARQGEEHPEVLGRPHGRQARRRVPERERAGRERRRTRPRWRSPRPTPRRSARSARRAAAPTSAATTTVTALDGSHRHRQRRQRRSHARGDRLPADVPGGQDSRGGPFCDQAVAHARRPGRVRRLRERVQGRLRGSRRGCRSSASTRANVIRSERDGRRAAPVLPRCSPTR